MWNKPFLTASVKVRITFCLAIYFCPLHWQVQKTTFWSKMNGTLFMFQNKMEDNNSFCQNFSDLEKYILNLY